MWTLILQPLFQALCTEDYDRFSPTKQNLLCNGQSVLESILSNEDFLHQALNNQAGNKTLELGIQVPPPRFAYALAKKTLSIILVLDLRWVRTVLYQFQIPLEKDVFDENIFYCDDLNNYFNLNVCLSIHLSVCVRKLALIPEVI